MTIDNGKTITIGSVPNHVRGSSNPEPFTDAEAHILNIVRRKRGELEAFFEEIYGFHILLFQNSKPVITWHSNETTENPERKRNKTNYLTQAYKGIDPRAQCDELKFTPNAIASAVFHERFKQQSGKKSIYVTARTQKIDFAPGMFYIIKEGQRRVDTQFCDVKLVPGMKSKPIFVTVYGKRNERFVCENTRKRIQTETEQKPTVQEQYARNHLLTREYLQKKTILLTVMYCGRDCEVGDRRQFLLNSFLNFSIKPVKNPNKKNKNRI